MSLNPSAGRHPTRRLQVQGPRKPPGDLALTFDKVSPIGLEPVGPNVCACLAIDQLDINLAPVPGPPDAALEDVADAQLAGRPVWRRRLSPCR